MHFNDVPFTIILKLSVHVKILYILDWIKQVYYCRTATFVTEHPVILLVISTPNQI